MIFNTIFKIFFLYTICIEIFLRLAWPPLASAWPPLNKRSGYGPASEYRWPMTSAEISQILFFIFNFNLTKLVILRSLIFKLKFLLWKYDYNLDKRSTLDTANCLHKLQLPTQNNDNFKERDLGIYKFTKNNNISTQRRRVNFYWGKKIIILITIGVLWSKILGIHPSMGGAWKHFY